MLRLAAALVNSFAKKSSKFPNNYNTNCLFFNGWFVEYIWNFSDIFGLMVCMYMFGMTGYDIVYL